MRSSGWLLSRRICSGRYAAAVGSSARCINAVSDARPSLLCLRSLSQGNRELLSSKEQCSTNFYLNQERFYGTGVLPLIIKTGALSAVSRDNIASQGSSRSISVDVRKRKHAAEIVRNSAVTSDSSLKQLIEEFEVITDNLTERSGRFKELKNALQSHFEDPNCLRVIPVTWEETSAEAIEIITRNEAVHPVSTFARTKRRFSPADRRVFAIVHNEMPSLPLACVHVALTDTIVHSLQALGELDEHAVRWDPSCLEKDKEALEFMLRHTQESGSNADSATCAIFYTVSNLHPHLPLPPIGKSLIKGAMQYLQASLPQLKTFSTLSPVPGFTQWLKEQFNQRHENCNQTKSLHQILIKSSGQLQVGETDLDTMAQVLHNSVSFAKQKTILRQYGQQFDSFLLYYLTKVKRSSQKVDSSAKPPKCVNSVAHFHLSSGASLHHIHCPFIAGTRPGNDQSQNRTEKQTSSVDTKHSSNLAVNSRNALNHPLVTERMWDYSLGYMVNYLYDLSSKSKNAELYKKDGTVHVTYLAEK